MEQDWPTTAEELAEFFHEEYEKLAPTYGYETRKESAVPWSKVPENNRRLMTEVARRVLEELFPDRPDVEPPDYKMQMYQGDDGQWRWRLVSLHNGQVVGGNQEGHVTKTHTRQMMERLLRPGAIVIEDEEGTVPVAPETNRP